MGWPCESFRKVSLRMTTRRFAVGSLLNLEKYRGIICCTVNKDLMAITINQEFSIHYTRELRYGPPDTGLEVDVYFDGEYIDGCLEPIPEDGGKKISGEFLGSR